MSARDRWKAGAGIVLRGLVLVDREGHLRGVYDGTLPHEIDLLIKDMKALTR